MWADSFSVTPQHCIEKSSVEDEQLLESKLRGPISIFKDFVHNNLCIDFNESGIIFL